MAVADPSTATTIQGFRALTPVSGGNSVWDSFNGYSEELKRDVNLALIRAEALKEDAVRKKFAEVAKVVAALQHPSIQRCLMVVPLPDGRWSVMSEPVEGETLQQHLDKRGALSCDEAVQLVMQLCDAVDAAHQRGVIHGDVAPNHVQLPGGLHALKPKLTAIGLGLLRSHHATGYSAPELLGKNEPTALSDLYSLGALLYGCLTGHPPPAGMDPAMLPMPPGSEHLVPSLQRCLAHDPSKRYFAAAELSKALQKANGTLVPPAQKKGSTEPLLPASAGPNDTFPSDTMLGPYQLVSLLGEGSMGQVFLARHKTLGRQVAIKVLRAEQYSRGDLIQRFFQEARTVNQINHEHIVEIFDFVQEPGVDGPSAVYCVMELLQGTSLAALAEAGPVSLKRTLNIVRQLCDALFAAHKVGVVHRDVKPDNIFLIERAGQTDYVKVLDFGVAKLTMATPDAPLISTMDGAIIGTPMCMAPEQASGSSVDHRADIYAAGVILYLLLSGRLPFEAKNFATLAVQLITQPPPPLDDRTPSGEQLDPGLKALVFKCLEKQPENRPQTMRELAEGLVPYMSMSAVRASNPSQVRPAPQMRPVPAQSSKAPFIAALGLIAVLAAGGVAYLAMRPQQVVYVEQPKPPPVAVVEPPKPVVDPPKPVAPLEQVEPVKPVDPPKPPPPAKPVKLTEAIILESLIKGGHDLNQCMDRYRTELKDAKGALEVTMTVNPQGVVTDAQLKTPGYEKSPLSGCVVKGAKKVRFPKNLGPSRFVVPVTYTKR